MIGRSAWIGSSLVVALAAPGLAQNVKWNDRIARDTAGDAPMVRVTIDGPRAFDYGAPVRVRFSVSEDAYVIVARVDGYGHLTLLYPANRSSSLVSAGENIPVRSRRSGSWATFYATDRSNGGYVFAMASYEPFDLSRLTIRDFDRYVTGTYVGRPARTYVGDPHRVIDRFAGIVSYDENTPFDYDVDFYQVDAPTWVSSAGYSRFCDYGGGYRSLQERWDDDLYSGSSAYGGGCSSLNRWNSYCYSSLSAYGYGFIPCVGGLSGQVARGPQVPGTPRDSARRTNPWVGDSVARPDTVSRVPNGGAVRPQQRVGDGTIVLEATRRPTVLDYDDSDRVFSIPDRALRGIRRDRREEPQQAPFEPGSRTGAIAGDGQIRWVRPPREIERGASGTEGPPNAINRGPRGRGEALDDGRPGRGDGDRLPPLRNSPRGQEPSRDNGPRFDAPPPSVRNGRDIYNAPPRSGPSRAEPSRAQPARSEPRVERRDPPPPPPHAPVVHERPADKKPEKPH